jgi:hypothetical protein
VILFVSITASSITSPQSEIDDDDNDNDNNNNNNNTISPHFPIPHSAIPLVLRSDPGREDLQIDVAPFTKHTKEIQITLFDRFDIFHEEDDFNYEWSFDYSGFKPINFWSYFTSIVHGNTDSGIKTKSKNWSQQIVTSFKNISTKGKYSDSIIRDDSPTFMRALRLRAGVEIYGSVSLNVTITSQKTGKKLIANEIIAEIYDPFSPSFSMDRIELETPDSATAKRHFELKYANIATTFSKTTLWKLEDAILSQFLSDTPEANCTFNEFVGTVVVSPDSLQSKFENNDDFTIPLGSDIIVKCPTIFWKPDNSKDLKSPINMITTVTNGDETTIATYFDSPVDTKMYWATVGIVFLVIFITLLVIAIGLCCCACTKSCCWKKKSKEQQPLMGAELSWGNVSYTPKRRRSLFE